MDKTKNGKVYNLYYGDSEEKHLLSTHNTKEDCILELIDYYKKQNKSTMIKNMKELFINNLVKYQFDVFEDDYYKIDFGLSTLFYYIKNVDNHNPKKGGV